MSSALHIVRKAIITKSGASTREEKQKSWQETDPLAIEKMIELSVRFGNTCLESLFGEDGEVLSLAGLAAREQELQAEANALKAAEEKPRQVSMLQQAFLKSQAAIKAEDTRKAREAEEANARRELNLFRQTVLVGSPKTHEASGLEYFRCVRTEWRRNGMDRCVHAELTGYGFVGGEDVMLVPYLENMKAIKGGPVILADVAHRFAVCPKCADEIRENTKGEVKFTTVKAAKKDIDADWVQNGEKYAANAQAEEVRLENERLHRQWNDPRFNPEVRERNRFDRRKARR